jgi:hypothetical protein
MSAWFASTSVQSGPSITALAETGWPSLPCRCKAELSPDVMVTGMGQGTNVRRLAGTRVPISTLHAESNRQLTESCSRLLPLGTIGCPRCSLVVRRVH